MADLLYIHSDAGEGSTEFVDLSGNDIALTANGNVKHSTAQAKFGATAIYSISSGDKVTGILSTAIGTGDFTMDFWAYVNTLDSTHRAFFDNRETAGSASGFFVYVRSDTGLLSLYTNNTAAISGSAPTQNGWMHVAVVRSSGVTKLYKDGVQIGSNYTDGNNYSNTSFTICERHYLDGAQNKGYIDEFRIRNEAVWTANFTPPRTAYISKDSYRDLVMANSPCNYWRLGEASGNAIDERGEHDLTWTGTPVYEATGALVNDTDTAMTLDGSTEYALSSANNPTLNNASLSVEAWIYPISFANAPRIIHHGDRSIANNQGWDLKITTAGALSLATFNGTWTSWSTSDAAVAVDTWQHIVVAFTEGGSLSFYVDGQLVHSTTMTTLGNTTTQYFRLGALKSSSHTNVFPGSIDEVAVYDYPLSPQQIYRHYIEGSHLKEQGTRYEHRILMSKPVNYWRLDETAGPTSTDLMGEHDLTWA